MNCAEYEAELARLLAEEPTEDERRRLAASLEGHAKSCPSCGGSAALLDLLGRPTGERDLAPDPGDAYWAGFEARLASKLEAAAPARTGLPHRWWVAAAAAVVLLSVAGWLFRPQGDPEIAASGGTGPASQQAESVRADLPPDLVLSVNRASMDELEDELAALDAGPGPTDWDEELFPDVENLDAETQQRLLDWLRGQNTTPEGA